MLICRDCGAQQHILNTWYGGDEKCEHRYRDIVPSEHLVGIVRELCVLYTPVEIMAAARELVNK